MCMSDTSNLKSHLFHQRPVHDFSENLPSKSAKIPCNDDDDEDDTILSSIPVHIADKPKIKATTPLQATQSSSCRALVFDTLGDTLYTASNGGCLAAIDVNRGSYHRTSDNSVLWKIDDASPFGINTISYINPSTPHVGNCIATGDDEGVIRIWDVRICAGGDSGGKKGTAFDNCMSLPKGCISSFHENTDFISSFEVDSSGDTLLAASADGTLTVIDLRKGCKDFKQASLKKLEKMDIEPVKLNPKTVQGPFCLHRKSDDQEDELLSMCIMKRGKKVVCGTQNGVINFWSWNTWGDISDRFPGHPQSIDALLKVDEDTLLTGSSDGVVRVLQVQPDKLLGVLGDHKGFPVEKLRFGAGNRVVGSVSHDAMVRLWDASIFSDDDNIEDDDEAMEEEENEENEEGLKSDVGKPAAKKGGDDSEDDWEDMDSDDSMDDSDSDDDEDQKKKGRKLKTENEMFFEDL